jgi:putative transcriptional regulator
VDAAALRESTSELEVAFVTTNSASLRRSRHRAQWLVRSDAADRGIATLGQKIRAAREARGFTQAELAARAHVAQAYLSYLEHDQHEPSLSIAARISRELEISLEGLANTVEP